MMIQKLLSSKKEIIEFLEIQPEWQLENNSLVRSFKFKNFVSAFDFMSKVALEAEKLNHHPNWSNQFNKVHIALSTFDLKGISSLDLTLAQKINKIFNDGI